MTSRGPFSKAELRAQGISDSELREFVESGQLRRVHRGWYADAFTSEEAIRAIRCGGRLGCVSACAEHGLWVPNQRDLHVALNPGVPLPTLHHQAVQFHRLSRRCDSALLPVEDAVAQVLQRHDQETALVVIESAVDKQLLHEAEARAILRSAPARSARAIDHFSPLAQSGSETRLRLFFQQLRVPVQPQAFIPSIGHVDLLVGRSWILEADSAAHHSATRNVHIDCERDFHARALGYMRDRLSYQQIWHAWERTQSWLRSILRSRRHLQAPKPLEDAV